MNNKPTQKLHWLLGGLLLFSVPLSGQEELLYMENFEDPAREIIATPENNPDVSTVEAGKYIVIGGRDDGGNNMNARRMIGSDGLQVRAGGTLVGDWVFSMQDMDFDGTGLPRADEFPGEDMIAKSCRLKFPNIDIASYGNLRIELTIAAGFGAGNEPDDDFYIRTRIDGGDWIEIGGFKAPSSNNVPAYYLGPRDTVTTAVMDDRLILGFFGDWDFPVIGHGSIIEVHLTGTGNAGNEDYHIGEFRLYGTPGVNFVDVAVQATEVTEPESGGLANPLTLTLGSPAPAGGVTFTLTPSDSRSASSLSMPSSEVTIPEGQSSVVVPVEIVQDGQFTGVKVVDLYVDAPGYNREQARVLVTNVTEKPNVVIMEVQNLVPGNLDEDLFGDANGDGVRHNTRDQYIEIVNLSDYPVDMSGWRIGDDLADRHLIPDGTVLAPNQVLVVFGGGTPIGTFGGAIVQLPSGGGNGLGFNINSRAEIAFLDAPFGAAVDLINMPLIQDDVLAITAGFPEGHKGKDTTGSWHILSKDGPFDYGREYREANLHSNIAGSGQTLFSPGVWYDGTPYFEPENVITLTVEPATVLESAGASAATGTITLATAAPSGGYDVSLVTSGVMMHGDGTYSPDEIDLASLVVTVPEGSTQATFAIDAVDDNVLDGDRLVTFEARGGTYALPGSATLTVEDVAVSDLSVVINEINTDVNETATDYNLDGLVDDELGDQYVELVNTSGRLVNLSGWYLTWDTGGTFAADRPIHWFPDGTWLPDGGSIVVFGKIAPDKAMDATFANATVQTASNSRGGIKKNGLDMRIDTDFEIKLFNEHGFLVEIIEDIANASITQGMALTRNPDLTGELALHLEVSGSFLLASPGADKDGLAFAGNGSVYLPKKFINISYIDDTGVHFDPLFGWMATSGPPTTDTPWVYSYDLGTWWYVNPFSFTGNIWAYDFGVGAWWYSNYVFYPWVYNYGTASWESRM
ncbi:MAG: lamin tail domain-containing protein [Puniceicoccaceae bacterium]